MTKAITSVAAMQLVEQGKLDVDQPIGKSLPELAAPQVLEGFDDAGAPRLRPAKRPITLRHLLTHTAGFGYEVWDADLVRYVKASGIPSTTTAKLASLRMPLVFDPASAGNTASTSIGSAEPSKRSAVSRSASIFASTSSRRSAWRIPITRFRRHSSGWCGSISASPTVRLSRSASRPAVARVLERRRRPLFDRAGLPGLPPDADEPGALSAAVSCCSRRRWR